MSAVLFAPLLNRILYDEGLNCAIELDGYGGFIVTLFGNARMRDDVYRGEGRTVQSAFTKARKDYEERSRPRIRPSNYERE